MKEEWKEIRDYPNYMVSNMGRVKSLGRWIYKEYRGKRWQREKILKPSVDKIGYLSVGFRKNRKLKFFKVHRLVYEAFYGEIPKGMQVNHINEIKTDNRLENLNLMTPKENCNWGTAIQRRIEKQINGKLSKQVLKIDPISNEIVAEFPSMSEVQRQLGIMLSNISMCCNGKRNIAGGYKWAFKKVDC